jgi:hypothetical protein
MFSGGENAVYPLRKSALFQKHPNVFPRAAIADHGEDEAGCRVRDFFRQDDGRAAVKLAFLDVYVTGNS